VGQIDDFLDKEAHYLRMIIRSRVETCPEFENFSSYSGNDRQWTTILNIPVIKHTSEQNNILVDLTRKM
jgi:hypothetical protein